jgi:hypothetical protein
VRGDGKIVVEPRYTDARPFADGVARVNAEGVAGSAGVSGGLWGLVDGDGRVVAAPAWDGIQPFDSDGVALVIKDGRRGLVDRAGRVVLALRYTLVGGFHDGLALVSGGAEPRPSVGFVDDDERAQVDDPRQRGGGDGNRARGRFGFVDQKGREVIAIGLEDARGFHEGLAAVKSRGVWGVIDIKGKWLVKPAFSFIDDFVGGSARARRGGSVAGEGGELTGGKWGRIDKRGRFVGE